MNTKSIASTAIAALMTLALAVPATVQAGDRQHGHHGSSHHGGHKGGHKYKHHRKHKRKHYSKHRYNKHRNYGHRSHNNYYYDDDDNEDLLIGLVVGGILGYAINSAQHQDEISYDRYPARSNAYPANNGYVHNGSTCLQEREYQTTVIVGGRKVDAYGTACLQPDGSWKRSPATVASY